MAKTRTSKSGTLVTIDVSGLRQFAAALRKASPELAKDLRLGLKQGGELVANNARARSSWSKRIPRSIGVRASGLRVSVVAGGARAPEGAPLENKGQPGFFRHPVFGNREVWVNQRSRPYLRPAAEEEAPKVAQKVLEAVDKSLSDAGFSD